MTMAGNTCTSPTSLFNIAAAYVVEGEIERWREEMELYR
jgi:hypothetical protein